MKKPFTLVIRLNDFIFQSIHLRNKHINRFDVCSNPDCIYARELILEIEQKLLSNYNAEEAWEREIEKRMNNQPDPREEHIK